MEYIQGNNRNQIRMQCPDNDIEADNPVRIIDAFVNRLDLEKLDFEHTVLKQEGRPPFLPADFLKMYLYGYSGGTRIRSSRRLETECRRNIELRWLLKELVPSHASIATFRRVHAKQLKEVFKMFTAFLYEQGLLDEKIVAIDGTKIRAQNSRKNNHSQNSLKKHLERMEEQTEHYFRELDEIDRQESAQQTSGMNIRKDEIKERLKKLETSKEKYTSLKEMLDKSGENQLSTTDPESRSLQTRGNQTEVGYNIQCATEAKNKLIAAFDVINTNDYNQLHPMAQKAKASLHTEELIAIADRGYFHGKQIEACEKDDIIPLVSPKDYVLPTQVPDERYSYEHFKYNQDEDCYVCPEGQMLTTNGKINKRTKGNDKESYEVTFKRYKTTACRNCPVKHLCTHAKQGRVLHRYDYHDTVERNNKRIKEQWQLYQTRQSIVEHPFGTIKRSWSYTYTLLKGIKKVSADMALIFLSYNIRRAMSIIGITALIERLQTWKMPSVG